MGETNIFVIRLLCSLTGTVLSAFVLVVVLRKRARGAEDWLLAGVLTTSALWHAANATYGLLSAGGNTPGNAAFAPFQIAVAAVGAALLLHLSMVWVDGRAFRVGLVAYPIAILTSREDPGRAGFAAALLLSFGLTLVAGRRRPERARFYLFIAFSLLIWAVSVLTGASSALAAFASLLPLLCLIVFIRRANVFDLLISRRILFVFTLSLITALYLVAVRLLSGWMESEFGAFGPVVEIALILGAAITWLPVYQVVTRFFSRENRMHAEFSRRVIEEAAAILDPGERAQYLVEQVGRTFRLRRAALVVGGDPPRFVAYPQGTAAPALDTLRQLTVRSSEARGAIHARRLEKHDAAAKILSESGYSYLFPLRYQDRLNGMLLLDPSPRVFLDNTEPTLLGLASQISLSLESCRLSESKARLEKELIEQRHLATLGGFAATIAHEVKNPLSSIKTLAQLLEEDPDVRDRYGRELAFIVGETNRLSSCVQQLLTFARPLPEANEEVALSELLENTAAFLSPDDARPGVAVERRIEPQLRLPASDRKSIEQVVLNLLLNAIQASPSYGRVVLHARMDENGAIRVEIADQGPGIPADLRARVFEPFFTTKPKGTGLGLAIVRKHVQHLGAQIDLVSPVVDGHGTKVSVVFPGKRDL
jgi:signal transduction histidine kinase